MQLKFQDLAWYKFSSFFQMASLSVATLFPLYWKEVLFFSSEKIGYLNAIASFIGLSSPLYFGQLGGKKSLEKVILTCFVASSLLCLLMLGFTSFIMQLLFLAMFAFMRTGFTTLVPVGVLNLFEKNAGQGYGEYRRFGSFGFLLGVVLTSYLVEIYPIKLILWIVAVCLSIASIPYFNKLKIKILVSQELPNYSQCFKVNSFKWLLISMMIISTWWASAFIYLPLIMKDIGARSSMIGWTISVCGIVAMCFLRIVGKWADNVDYKKILLMVPIFAALRIFFYSCPEEEPFWFLLIQLLHLPTWVVSEVVIMKLLKQTLPQQLLSRGQALLQVCQTLGMSLGSFIIAGLLSQMNLKEAHQVFALCPLLAYPFLIKLMRA